LRYIPITALLFVNIFIFIAAAACFGQQPAPASAASENASNQQPGGLLVSPADPASPAVPAAPASGYTFPTGSQQFRNYLNTAVGPQGFIAAAIGAGLDQSKPAPPEWDHGAKGLAERYGARYGMVLLTTTAKYSLGAAMRQDVSYHKCDCAGFFPRTLHALTSTVTARTRSGRTVPSVPALVSPYASSLIAVKAWYPARYEPQDALRIGTVSFTFNAGANLVREFLLPRR
jgi:hypothetical protein